MANMPSVPGSVRRFLRASRVYRFPSTYMPRRNTPHTARIEYKVLLNTRSARTALEDIRIRDAPGSLRACPHNTAPGRCGSLL